MLNKEQTKVREYLISKSKKDQPIYYEDVVKECNLNLNLSIQKDRDILSSILGEISSFEDKNNRPLLSSMAIYKATNEHGYGFYEICEQLGKGKATNLKTKLYGFEQQGLCRTFWRNEDNFNKFYSLSSHKLSFFNKKEIDFFSSWAGKVYDKDDIEHVAAKNFIMNSVGTKTVYWSNELIKKLPEYETFNWRMWSQKGWQNINGKNVRVAIFKPYTWARIYKKGDKDKNIFFTIGTDSNENGLVYKLDYYFEANSNLNEQQKEIVRNNIPSNLRWNVIKVNDLDNLNWEKLIKIVADFISENSSVYDNLIKLVWGNEDAKELFVNCLKKGKPNINKYSSLPILKPSFKGVTKDFISEAIEKKEIGDAGEELVLQYEKNKLKALGKNHLAEKVEKVLDGKGYDILSYDINEKEIYIEVKTTTSNENKSFDISINEYLFAEQNINNYFIYRLYNYDDETNNAEFFIIENPIEKLLFQPTGFKAYHKL